MAVMLCRAFVPADHAIRSLQQYKRLAQIQSSPNHWQMATPELSITLIALVLQFFSSGASILVFIPAILLLAAKLTHDVLAIFWILPQLGLIANSFQATEVRRTIEAASLQLKSRTQLLKHAMSKHSLYLQVAYF